MHESNLMRTIVNKLSTCAVDKLAQREDQAEALNGRVGDQSAHSPTLLEFGQWHRSETAVA
eukprot:15437648-Alexandrium_andersonii.AAC.1